MARSSDSTATPRWRNVDTDDSNRLVYLLAAGRGYSEMCAASISQHDSRRSACHPPPVANSVRHRAGCAEHRRQTARVEVPDRPRLRPGTGWRVALPWRPLAGHHPDQGRSNRICKPSGLGIRQISRGHGCRVTTAAERSISSDGVNGGLGSDAVPHAPDWVSPCWEPGGLGPGGSTFSAISNAAQGGTREVDDSAGS